MVTKLEMDVSCFCYNLTKLGKLDQFHFETLEQLRLKCVLSWAMVHQYNYMDQVWKDLSNLDPGEPGVCVCFIIIIIIIILFYFNRS